MPDGKPAGIRCAQLSDDYRCKLYGDPSRPKVCIDFQASLENCGTCREEALQILSALEQATK